MKKIIIKLFIILSLLVIIDRVGTLIFKKIIFSKTLSGESGGGINYLIQKKKNTEFIVLGSSRAKHHINPALLTNLYNGNGYNAGINGTGGIIYNSLLLPLLLSNGVTPKAIILQVDAYPYFTVSDDNITLETSQLYPFINEDDSLKKFITTKENYAEKIKLLLHSYRFNGKFLNIIYNYLKRKSVTDNNGFEGLPGIMDTTGFSISPDLNQEHHYSKIKMDALANIAQTCKTNNIKLAVVFPPSFKNYLYLRSGTDSIIKTLQANGVLNIYDFSDVEKISLLKPRALWRDATHLNNNGATIFSKMLNDSLAYMK